MALAHVDARDGVTGEMLLGALVDAGASVERVEAAVRTLGVGPVRLAWARVPRGGATACTVRVHAPEQAPTVPTWARVHQVLTHVALPDVVRDRAREAVHRLVAAEADAAGVAVEDLRLSEVGVLDTMAVTVAVCAAVHDLDLDRVTVGPVGVGSGPGRDAAGAPVAVPAPAVHRLLRGFEVVAHEVAVQLTSATGAALIASLARPGGPVPRPAAATVGVGAGARVDGGDRVLRITIASGTTPPPTGPSG